MALRPAGQKAYGGPYSYLGPRAGLCKKKNFFFYFSLKNVANLEREEEETDGEVSQPVDEDCNGHGGRAGTLTEQFGRDHPGNGTGSHGEEHDEWQRGHHGHVSNPFD